jgi:hypothetical protein
VLLWVLRGTVGALDAPAPVADEPG